MHPSYRASLGLTAFLLLASCGGESFTVNNYYGDDASSDSGTDGSVPADASPDSARDSSAEASVSDGSVQDVLGQDGGADGALPDSAEPPQDGAIDSCVAQSCLEFAGQCGSLTDRCGNALSCGCEGAQVCLSGQCCTPKSCAELGVQCGSFEDGCGQALNCSCGMGQVCLNNQCCTPHCDGSNCLADGCGSTCQCSGGNTCSPNGVCAPNQCGSAVCGNDPNGNLCGMCMYNQICSGGQCVPNTACGNQVCDAGETCASCAWDCPCQGYTHCMPSGVCEANPWKSQSGGQDYFWEAF